jgi:hypothetical protein
VVFPHQTKSHRQKLVFPATELRELVLSVRETGFPFPLEPVLAQYQQEGNSYAEAKFKVPDYGIKSTLALGLRSTLA